MGLGETRGAGGAWFPTVRGCSSCSWEWNGCSVVAGEGGVVADLSGWEWNGRGVMWVRGAENGYVHGTETHFFFSEGGIGGDEAYIE